MTNPDTKWANQSRCSVMVSDLLSTVVVGTLWSVSICGHLAGQSWSRGFDVPSYFNRGLDALIGILLVSIHALV